MLIMYNFNCKMLTLIRMLTWYIVLTPRHRAVGTRRATPDFDRLISIRGGGGADYAHDINTPPTPGLSALFIGCFGQSKMQSYT